jgi:hypothetical protein
MRHAPPADDHRARLTALLRAAVLAGLGLVLVPLPAFAADGDTSGDPPAVQPAEDPPPEPTPEPTPQPEVQSVLIYAAPAVIRQYKNYWCVPAATQTMWNLIHGTANAKYGRQKALYSVIRKHNRYRYVTKGNDIAGWAWALRTYTGEAYQARSFGSKNAAMQAIVDAIDRSGHPVGITVHHGTHAWVVLGYKAQADAADASKRTILGFYVSGPLGPGSRDPWKYRYMSIASFRKVYGKYHEATRKVIWEKRYVVVSD